MALQGKYIVFRDDTGKANAVVGCPCDQRWVLRFKVITVHEIKHAAISNRVPQRVRLYLSDAIPAHMRNLQSNAVPVFMTITKILYLTRKNSKAFGALIFFAEIN